MTTITQSLTTPVAAPDPATQSPSAFSTTAAAFVVWQRTFALELQTWTTQANTVATEVSAFASQVAVDASASAANAALAVAAAGATLWVSGTTYAIGDRRYSPLNGLTYRRLTTGAGTTDPSADTTNWQIVQVSFPVITVSGTTQTAVAGYQYTLTNGAVTTVTLPASPVVGDKVIVKVANGLETNVVNPNGATIEGVSGNMTIDNAYAVVNLQYLNSSWRLV